MWRGAAQSLGVAHDEMLDEQGDVAAPLAHRRDGDGDHLQAKQQVLAKAAGGHLELEVAVRRRYHAHVDLDGLRRADAADLPSCRTRSSCTAAILTLQNLADLVEKERPTLGLLEKAALLRAGAGEAPALVAEELTLQDRLG